MIMKKSIILIAAALMSVAASAERVSQSVASNMASDFFKTHKAMVPVRMPATRAAGGTTASQSEFYIFDNPDGGWAIIAADNLISPVLAYSPTGSFSTSEPAPGLVDWMEEINATVVNMRESGIEASERVAQMWQSPLVSDPAPGDTLILKTALWDQDDPYNLYCPVAPGEMEKSATGCVATAMGIIMRYHKWPQKAEGVIGGYNTRHSGMTFHVPSYSIDNHYYDWDNMPETNGSGRGASWKENQKMEVATLLHDCGVSVEMSYAVGNSGAYTIDATRAFIDHFSYPDADLQFRSEFSTEEWFNRIKIELDNDRPVLYSGNGDSGGHAFVCDGYDTAHGMLHMNWGWGGSGNGFYTLDFVLSDRLALGDDHDAIFGLEPGGVPGGTGYQPRIISFYGAYGPGLTFSADHVAAGGDLTIYAYYMTATGHEAFETSIRVCLMDKDGNEKEVVVSSSPITFIPGEIAGYKFGSTLKTTPVFTDYYQLFYKKTDGTWAPVTVDNEIYEDGGYVTCGVTSDPMIIVDGNYAAGDVLELKLSRGDYAVKSVEWTFDGEPCEGSVTLHTGVNVIRADLGLYDESSAVITKKITIE